VRTSSSVWGLIFRSALQIPSNKSDFGTILPLPHEAAGDRSPRPAGRIAPAGFQG
jgi:hypothetical protein